MGIVNERQYVLMTVKASSVHGLSSKKKSIFRILVRRIAFYIGLRRDSDNYLTMTQPLLTPGFWILPLNRELLNSARRNRLSAASERVRGCTGLVKFVCRTPMAGRVWVGWELEDSLDWTTTNNRSATIGAQLAGNHTHSVLIKL